MNKDKKYTDLTPEERAPFERAWGGRLPVDAEVLQDNESGFIRIGTSINSPTAKDEDFLVSTESQ